MEKDPVRGLDSINTFREILQLAQKHEVGNVFLQAIKDVAKADFTSTASNIIGRLHSVGWRSVP